MSEETARARQSRVARSGGSWEEYVRLRITHCGKLLYALAE